jgi:hypothetical protein
VLEIGRRGGDRPDAAGHSEVEIGPLVLGDSPANYMKRHLREQVSSVDVMVDTE